MAWDIDVGAAANVISVSPIRATTTLIATQRPTVGMKRPRSHYGLEAAKKCPRRADTDCSRCRHLLAENRELKEVNALLTEQLSQCRLQAANTVQQHKAPRPGKVPKALAEKHQV